MTVVESRPAVGRDARLAKALTVVLALSLAVNLAQIGSLSYLRGDSDNYLRDAIVAGEGRLPRSRYSPGFAILLAPVVRLAGGSASDAGTAALVLNALVGVAALALLFRFLAARLAPWTALGLVAVLALGQAVAVYFAELRPEALTLLLVTGSLLLLERGRAGWAAALGGLAVLVRVALAPFFVVLWAARARAEPRAAAAGVLLAALAALATLAPGTDGDQSYTSAADSVFSAEDGGDAGPEALAGAVRANLVEYGVYGLPRLIWPQAVLSSPLGPPLAGATLAVMALGLVAVLVAGRRFRGTVLAAAGLGFLAYQAALLAWPVTRLAAVRFLLPVAAVPLAAAGFGLDRLRARLGPGARSLWRPAAAVVLGAAIAAAGVTVSERLQGPGALGDYAAAHERARPHLPPGPVISRKPATTQLLTGRRSYAFVPDVALQSRRTGTCTFVMGKLSRVHDGAEDWVERRVARTLAHVGGTRIVVIDAPWCRGR